MKKRSLVVSSVLASSAVLAGCSTELNISSKEYEKYGYSAEVADKGLYVVPESFLIECGSWTPYNTAFKDDKEYPGVYYCTGDEDKDIFLYKGVISFNFKTLTTSQYYISNGSNKSDVHVTKSFKDNNLTPAYNGQMYSVLLVEDPTARFDENLPEEKAEGTLVTQEELDSQEWKDYDEDSEVMVSSNNSAIYAGVIFASILAMQNSNYYKSKGTNTSAVAIPAAVKSGKSSLAYSNGKYFSNGSVKSTKISTLPSSSKASNPLGAVTSKGNTAVGGTSSAMKQSSSISKAATSSKSGSISSGSRGSGGVSSGARGGGAS